MSKIRFSRIEVNLASNGISICFWIVMGLNWIIFFLLFADWAIMHVFFPSADFFQNQHFQKILSAIPSEYQTVCTQIRPDILSGLIWVQTVCKDYQQATPVGKELRVHTCCIGLQRTVYLG